MKQEAEHPQLTTILSIYFPLQHQNYPKINIKKQQLSKYHQYIINMFIIKMP